MTTSIKMVNPFFLILAAITPNILAEFWECPEGSPNEVSWLSDLTRVSNQNGLGLWKIILKKEFRLLLITNKNAILNPVSESMHQNTSGMMKMKKYSVASIEIHSKGRVNQSPRLCRKRLISTSRFNKASILKLHFPDYDN